MAEQPPLVLCMEKANGEDVELHIDPGDDFQCFLDKAKSLLGFEVDINSITKNQPVSLTDDCYKFLINAEQSLYTETELTSQNLDEILPGNEENDDQVYILDDGTQIRASQIHFDNEDPLVDLTVETIPFVKYIDDGTDDLDTVNVEVENTKLYNIVESPVSKCSGINVSPKFGFVNSLPFKLVCNNTLGFESQFTKFLEANSNKSYATLNNVANRNKSPRTLIRENYKNYDDAFQSHRNAEDFAHYTREEILNVFKDSPVTSLPHENQVFNEKRRQRKSNPSRVYKNWNSKLMTCSDVNGVVIAESQSENCFICDKYVVNNVGKLYLFDNEDQRQYRSSPQKKMSTQLKIICEPCLEIHFKPSRARSPNQSLNPDEYLVIRNNQQYIFQKTTSINFKSISQSNVSTRIKTNTRNVSYDVFKETDRTEYVKVEIGSDGEIVTKPIDNDLRFDDVIVVKDETNSSDVEIVENGPEVDDNIIDNLEEADEDVKEFLGKYQYAKDMEDLKCRFCERTFADVPEVIEHGETHKHVLEEGEVYPCPLCDYGYANFRWLKAHLKAAHVQTAIKTEDGEDKNGDGIKNVLDTTADTATPSPKESSPIARRTRSAVKRDVVTPQETTEKKQEDPKTIATNPEVSNDFEIKTEVKQECVGSSDDDIWIVQTADDEAEQQLQQILDAARTGRDGYKKHKCILCSRLFVSSEGLAGHKCRQRGRKRKPAASDDTAMRIPSKEDFIKRARGRPRLEEYGNHHTLTVRPGKKKTKTPTSDPQILTCHNCNESFTSKVRLKFHMQFHDATSMLTADGQYTCVECATATFGTETELFDHVHFQHKQKRWQCPMRGCDKTFYLRATLTKHSRMHTNTRRYTCSACGKRFLDKQTLDEHGVTHLQNKPFQCHICLKQLTRRSRMRMHLRAHEEELRPRLVLVCAVCARAFRDAAGVKEHLTKFPECIQQFANELKLEKEVVSVQLSPSSGLVRQTVQLIESPKLSKPIRLQASGALADGLLSLVSDEARAITRVVEIEKAFRCEYCEDVFYAEDGLNNHRVIHKGIKNPFTCHICKVSFASYSRCTTHKTTHGFYKRSLADAKRRAGASPAPGQHEAGPSATGILGYGDFPVVKHFLCQDCDRSYLHWTYLQVHRRMKHSVDNFKHTCSQCELSFPNSWSLTYHKKKAHTINTGMEDIATPAKMVNDYRIPCRDCDQVLPNKTALYKHRKKDHSDLSLSMNNNPGASGAVCHATRAAACAKCGHSFPTVGQLHAHLKEVHGHELDFTCSVCKKCFCSRAELCAHARTHAAARHTCAVCGRAFRTLSMRNEHLRTHTGERPFPCDVCGIAFRRSTAMRNHRLIHTGERAFPCSRCPKRFRIRSDLRTHLRLKHPAELVLIEVPGLNPTPEDVMGHLTKNNIAQDKVIEITKMSFPKGTTSVVPRTWRALSLLSAVPRAQVACGRARTMRDCVYELVQPARRGRGIAKNPRKPRLMQSGGDNMQADRNAYPVAVSMSSENGGGETNEQNPMAYPIALNISNEHIGGGSSQQNIAYPTADGSGTEHNPVAYPMALNVSGEELSELNMQLLLRDGAGQGSQMAQLQLDSMLLEWTTPQNK